MLHQVITIDNIRSKEHLPNNGEVNVRQGPLLWVSQDSHLNGLNNIDIRHKANSLLMQEHSR